MVDTRTRYIERIREQQQSIKDTNEQIKKSVKVREPKPRKEKEETQETGLPTTPSETVEVFTGERQFVTRPQPTVQSVRPVVQPSQPTETVTRGEIVQRMTPGQQFVSGIARDIQTRKELERQRDSLDTQARYQYTDPNTGQTRTISGTEARQIIQGQIVQLSDVSRERVATGFIGTGAAVRFSEATQQLPRGTRYEVTPEGDVIPTFDGVSSNDQIEYFRQNGTITINQGMQNEETVTWGEYKQRNPAAFLVFENGQVRVVTDTERWFEEKYSGARETEPLLFYTKQAAMGATRTFDPGFWLSLVSGQGEKYVADTEYRMRQQYGIGTDKPDNIGAFIEAQKDAYLNVIIPLATGKFAGPVLGAIAKPVSKLVTPIIGQTGTNIIKTAAQIGLIEYAVNVSTEDVLQAPDEKKLERLLTHAMQFGLVYAGAKSTIKPVAGVAETKQGNLVIQRFATTLKGKPFIKIGKTTAFGAVGEEGFSRIVSPIKTKGLTFTTAENFVENQILKTQKSLIPFVGEIPTPSQTILLGTGVKEIPIVFSRTGEPITGIGELQISDTGISFIKSTKPVKILTPSPEIQKIEQFPNLIKKVSKEGFEYYEPKKTSKILTPETKERVTPGFFVEETAMDTLFGKTKGARIGKQIPFVLKETVADIKPEPFNKLEKEIMKEGYSVMKPKETPKILTPSDKKTITHTTKGKMTDENIFWFFRDEIPYEYTHMVQPPKKDAVDKIVRKGKPISQIEKELITHTTKGTMMNEDIFWFYQEEIPFSFKHIVQPPKKTSVEKIVRKGTKPLTPETKDKMTHMTKGFFVGGDVDAPYTHKELITTKKIDIDANLKKEIGPGGIDVFKPKKPSKVLTPSTLQEHFLRSIKAKDVFSQRGPLSTKVLPKPKLYEPSLPFISFLESGVSVFETKPLIRMVKGKKRGKTFTLKDLQKKGVLDTTEKDIGKIFGGTKQGGVVVLEPLGQKTILKKKPVIKTKTLLEPKGEKDIIDLVEKETLGIRSPDYKIGALGKSLFPKGKRGAIPGRIKDVYVPPVLKTGFDIKSETKKKPDTTQIKGIHQIQQKDVGTKQLEKQLQKQMQEPATKQMQKQMQIQQLDLMQEQIPMMGFGTAQMQLSLFDLVPIQTTDLKLTTIKTPPILLPPDIEKQVGIPSGRQGYDVYIKPRQYKNGKKIRDGRFNIKANKKTLTRDQALKFGHNIVDKNEKASFKLIPSDKPATKTRVRGESFWTHMMDYNQKKNDVYTEKSSARIDSPGEIRAITMKGIEANRKKRGRGSRISSIEKRLNRINKRGIRL